MGEGCGFARHRGVVTEDLGTGPMMWWPLEWMSYMGGGGEVLSSVGVEKLWRGLCRLRL